MQRTRGLLSMPLAVGREGSEGVRVGRETKREVKEGSEEGDCEGGRGVSEGMEGRLTLQPHMMPVREAPWG